MHISPSSQRPDKEFALHRYGRAINMLVDPDPNRGPLKPAPGVYLIASILFTCFENLAGNYSLVLAHLQFGFRLLQEMTSGCTLPQFIASMPIDLVMPLLLRLRAQYILPDSGIPQSTTSHSLSAEEARYC